MTLQQTQESNDMAMKHLSKAVALAAMAISGSVMAADVPKLSEILDASGITVTGYVDAAYTHYDKDPAEQTAILNYFDDNENSFGLKQASLTIASQPKEGFGALVNLTAGSDADWIHSNGGSDSSNFDVTQAWVQYATGPFTIIGGKFNTLAGAEVIAPTGNTNISRSVAFLYALPFTHTGVRLAVAPLDTLTLYAGINNGWDQQKDVNSAKTGELGLIWNPTSAVGLAASVYSGKETICDPTGGFDVDGACLADQDTNRFLFDTVLTIKPIDGLSLIVNYDMGKQEDAVLNGAGTDTDDAEWTALVGYVNYQFNEQWRVSFRAEQFDDKDGYRIGLSDQDFASSSFGELSDKTTTLTLTVGFAPTANFELRGEVRQDKTDKEALIDGDSTTDKQVFAAVEALYKF
jgi:putative OmpL-like beta-barrel porin-2